MGMYLKGQQILKGFENVNTVLNSDKEQFLILF